MKFWKIFRYEFRYQLNHVSTWLLFVLFVLFGFVFTRIGTPNEGTFMNSPGMIAFCTVFGSAVWVVFGGVIAGDAATRDRQTRMYPLTYTTPVSKFNYLGARFLSALALNSCVLLLLYIGFVLSFYGPGAKTEFIGPFRLVSYLTNFVFLVIPIIIAATAIQFAFAALSGRAIASYFASIAIIIFSQFGGTTVRFLLEWKVIGSLMDLLGTGLIAEMESWTPIDWNSRLITLEGLWLWNRFVWFTIAALVLVITYYRFHFAHITSKGGWFNFFRKRKETLPTISPFSSGAVLKNNTTSWSNIPNLVRDFTFGTYVRQVCTIAAASFGVIAKSRGGLVLVLALAVGTGLFATEYMEFYGVPLTARTQEVLRIFAAPLSSYKTQWIIIPLLTIFYAGELVWREREAGLHDLSDTSPVRETVLFLGKFLGFALIIFIWVAFLLLGGVVNQLVMDHHQFEFAVYVKALFGIQFTNYLLFALLVFTIHVLVNQKYIGHMVALGVYGYILFSSTIEIEHIMLVYASDTGWAYSDMSGFGPFIKPWLWMKFYWASWGILLAVVGLLFWVRSKEEGLKKRLYLAKRRLPKHKLALIIALTLVVVSSSFVFYNTNVLNKYRTNEDRMEMRAEYERRYGQYEQIAQPVLARTKLHVEIYPDVGSAAVQATYFLVNRSKEAIDSIHLSAFPYVNISDITLNRAATPVVVDDELGYRIFSLKESLRPGDSLQMGFLIQIEPRGFSNNGVDVAVVANGSHIDSNDWMPIVGYHGDRRLLSARDRDKYGLAPRAERPSLQDKAAPSDTRHADPMDFEAIVGTAKEQLAVAPGALRKTWTKGVRRYFHYVTNAPITNEYAVFSANYALREAQWTPPIANLKEGTSGAKLVSDMKAQPVTIQIFYHPAHTTNIERMMKSAQASLTYFTKEFGPYPYDYFRVMERPGPGRGMHAEAMTIDYQEGYSFMNPKQDGLDLPYHIMAHEVAHQWWGFQLAPAPVEGAGLLVESFATYSAMQVVEETLGYAHLLKYLTQMRQEYEMPHSKAAPPLLWAKNAFQNYRKGPFALFALRHYIGKEKVNDAMRQLMQKFPPQPPLPTTLDFYKELQAVTPDSLHYLVHDLFAANTFWELETDKATAVQTANGNWQVTLEVQAQKIVVDEQGVEKDVPMQDWVEIGVFAPLEEGETTGKFLYRQKHRIRSGKQKLKVTVPAKPGRAGIDPHHLLIDLDMEDNTKKVEMANK